MAAWRPARVRGFTVVEVMIALALFVLVGALVMPSLSGFADRVELDSVCSEVSSAIASASTRAARRGEMLELVARRGDGGTIWLTLRPIREQGLREEDTFSGAGPVVHESGQHAAEASPGEARLPLDWHEDVLDVGLKVRVATTPPWAETDLSATSATSAGLESSPARPVRLAVFLPDGQLVLAGTLYVSMASRAMLGNTHGAAGPVEFAVVEPPAKDAVMEEKPTESHERVDTSGTPEGERGEDGATGSAQPK